MPKRPRRRGLPGARAPRAKAPRVRRPTAARPKVRIRRTRY